MTAEYPHPYEDQAATYDRVRDERGAMLLSPRLTLALGGIIVGTAIGVTTGVLHRLGFDVDFDKRQETSVGQIDVSKVSLISPYTCYAKMQAVVPVTSRRTYGVKIDTPVGEVPGTNVWWQEGVEASRDATMCANTKNLVIQQLEDGFLGVGFKDGTTFSMEVSPTFPRDEDTDSYSSSNSVTALSPSMINAVANSTPWLRDHKGEIDIADEIKRSLRRDNEIIASQAMSYKCGPAYMDKFGREFIKAVRDDVFNQLQNYTAATDTALPFTKDKLVALPVPESAFKSQYANQYEDIKNDTRLTSKISTSFDCVFPKGLQQEDERE